MTLKLAAAALSLVGLAGTVLPGLPGTLLIFAVALGYAWLTGFLEVPAKTLWILGGLAAVAQAGEALLGAASTRLAGASRRAAVGALVGALLGTLVFGPVGLVSGPFLGAFLAELIGGRDLMEAGIAGAAAGVGALFGTLLQVVIGIAMVVLFWIAIF